MHKSKEPETLDFLLAQVSHLHRSRAFQVLEDIGLYRGQPPVLRALWEQEGLTQTELAERLHNSPATVTKMLQRMEKAGFIARKPDLEDQRVTRVYLTDAGRAIQTRVQAIWQQFDEENFAGFTLEERVLLRRFLMQIRDTLQELMGENGGLKK